MGVPTNKVKLETNTPPSWTSEDGKLVGAPRLNERGRVPIRCSNCDAPLCEVLMIGNSQQPEWKIKAECPHCGDMSFIHKVCGRFQLGAGAFDVNEEDSEIYTIIVDYKIDYENDVLIVKTAKGKDYE